jgi:5-methyltetrahydropteroyltriglutamate--homocysteine methyltransferase
VFTLPWEVAIREGLFARAGSPPSSKPGLILQVDSPDTTLMRNRQLWQVPWGDYRRHLALRLEALNAALDGLPEERVRFQVCCGNFEGPHQNDVPLQDVLF